jgi:hypothetical protein
VPSVRFTATRSLIPGVSQGATVVYTLPVRYAGMSRTRSVVKHTRRSLSGRRETYAESTENSYQISTKPLTPTQQPHLVMFLDSVEEGETFGFAPTDEAFSDSILEGAGYEETRQPERDSMFLYSLQITVLP